MRIAITGGSGFIGSHLVDGLVGLGHEILVLDDLSTGSESNLESAMLSGRVRLERMDISRLADVERAFKLFQPEQVVHLAALVSVPRSIEEPELSFRTNVMGTFNVFSSALKLPGGGKVTYASSAAVYGGRQDTPHVESMKVSTLSPYASDKAYAENLAQAMAHSRRLRAVGLRFFNVYGERQSASSPYSGVISIFASKLMAEKVPTIFGDGGQMRDFVHVSDVVEAIRASMEFLARPGPAGIAEVFNVGTGSQSTVRDLFSLMAGLLGRDCAPAFAPARDAEVRNSVADIGRAREVLGWSPRTPLREGLLSLMEFLRKEAGRG